MRERDKNVEISSKLLQLVSFAGDGDVNITLDHGALIDSAAM